MKNIFSFLFKSKAPEVEIKPKKVPDIETYREFEKCRNYIREKLQDTYWICESKRTIEASNRFFYMVLSNAKKKAYSMVNPADRAIVIEWIEKYYSY